MKPKITYQQLREELEKSGWKADLVETENFGVRRQSTVFQHPETELYVILPKRKPSAFVEPIHLLHVRNVLENAGFWESLMRQINAENRNEATGVLQTLAAIKPSKNGSGTALGVHGE
jgi:hypothetical protein